MNDLAGETRRVTQPTIAFHNQPTVAVGSNDLARELFRQCTSTSSLRGSSLARSSKWDAPTATRPRPRGNLRTLLVCLGCLLLGAGAGHVVREGSAYAAGAAVVGAVAQSRSAVSLVARSPRTTSSIGATAQGTVRAKDLTAVTPEAPVAARATVVSRGPAAPRASGRGPSRKTPAQAAARPAPPISMDALFVDFEPVFRVAQ